MPKTARHASKSYRTASRCHYALVRRRAEDRVVETTGLLPTFTAAELEGWLATRPTLPYTDDVARLWGEISAHATRRGRPRPQNDTLIAAERSTGPGSDAPAGGTATSCGGTANAGGRPPHGGRPRLLRPVPELSV